MFINSSNTSSISPVMIAPHVSLGYFHIPTKSTLRYLLGDITSFTAYNLAALLFSAVNIWAVKLSPVPGNLEDF